jgi:hypothetical protein
MNNPSDIFLRPSECAKKLSISINSLKRLERAGIICAHRLPLLDGERRFYWPDVVAAVKHPADTGMVVGVQIGRIA